MAWLVPAQTLLDLLSSAPNPADAWTRTARVALRDLRLSVITIAQAKAAIAGLRSAAVRIATEADLAALLAQIRNDSIAPLAFHDAHASVWQGLVHDVTIGGVPQVDRQVYATAMYEGLTVVEAARPQTPALRRLGVRIDEL